MNWLLDDLAPIYSNFCWNAFFGVFNFLDPLAFIGQIIRWTRIFILKVVYIKDGFESTYDNVYREKYYEKKSAKSDKSLLWKTLSPTALKSIKINIYI